MKILILALTGLGLVVGGAGFASDAGSDEALLKALSASKQTLLSGIQQSQEPGTVYSVIPVLRDRKPVFTVRVAADGKTVDLAYDAMTGKPLKGK